MCICALFLLFLRGSFLAYYSFKSTFLGSPWVERPVQGKDYLTNVKDLLWIRDVLGTEFMLGHQSLDVIVELYNTAIVLDPDDEPMCL
jgi:hypothetical protein